MSFHIPKIKEIKSLAKSYWGELVFIFSNTYSLAFTTLASLIATAFIAPKDMGVIQTVLLVETYLQFLQLGVFNGLNRNLAFYKAQNNHKLVQDMVNTTYTISQVVALIGAVVSLGLGLYFLVCHRPAIYIWSSLMLFFLLVFRPMKIALETTYRSGQEFKRLGVIKGKSITIYFFFSLLPIIIGYYGKLIADSVRSLVEYLMCNYKKPYLKTGKGSFSSLKLLLQTGFPILLTGYVWSVFMACDRTFIARYMTTEDMGFYALSNYVIIAVMAVPQSVNALLYPKAATRYGATGDVHALKAFWKKSLLVYSLMLIPICAVLYFIIPVFTENFMPKYVGGIRAAQYSLLTCMTFVAQGPGVIFGTLRRNGAYLAVGIISVALFWLISFSLRASITSIEQVSLLRFALSVIQMFAVLALTYKYVK